MRVILLKDVKDIGKRNTALEVSDGFARNFLIPRGLAKPATKEALEALGAEEQKTSKRAEADLKKAQALASSIDGLELIVKGRVAEPGGKLFAAITPKTISEVLQQQGYDIKASQLSFEPIKQSGDYPMNVSFEHGLETQIKVIVEEVVPEEL